MSKQKGFSTILVLLILAIAVAGGYYIFKYYVYQKQLERGGIVGGDAEQKSLQDQINYRPSVIRQEEASQAIDTTSWKTFTHEKTKFSFRYPVSWAVVSDSAYYDNPNHHYVRAFGKEGELVMNIVWDRQGLGGGCPENGYEQIKVNNSQVYTCHLVNDDGTEAWNQVNYEVGNIVFFGNATAYSPYQDNRDIVLKVISTLNFPN